MFTPLTAAGTLTHTLPCEKKKTKPKIHFESYFERIFSFISLPKCLGENLICANNFDGFGDFCVSLHPARKILEHEMKIMKRAN